MSATAERRLSHDPRRFSRRWIFEPRARVDGTSLTTMRQSPSPRLCWLGASVLAATLGCANSDSTTGSGSGGASATGGTTGTGGTTATGGATGTGGTRTGGTTGTGGTGHRRHRSAPAARPAPAARRHRRHDRHGRRDRHRRHDRHGRHDTARAARPAPAATRHWRDHRAPAARPGRCDMGTTHHDLGQRLRHRLDGGLRERHLDRPGLDHQRSAGLPVGALRRALAGRDDHLGAMHGRHRTIGKCGVAALLRQPDVPAGAVLQVGHQVEGQRRHPQRLRPDRRLLGQRPPRLLDRPRRHRRSLGPGPRVHARRAVQRRHRPQLRQRRQHLRLDLREPRQLGRAAAARVPHFQRPLLRAVGERAAPLRWVDARSLLRLAVHGVPQGQVLLLRGQRASGSTRPPATIRSTTS